MLNNINLNTLQILSVCGHSLSFRKAADELALTQGAVAQRIRLLEAQLGLKLFERQARGLSLTEAGREYLKEVDRALVIIDQATQKLIQGRIEIRVTTTPSFAAKWLMPRLKSFRCQYPGYDLYIQGSNQKAALVYGGFDCAIRLGCPPFPQHVRAEFLFRPELCLVANATYLSDLKSLTEEHLLLVDAQCAWEDQVSDPQLQGLKRMRLSQTSLAIDAALAGQGLTVTPFEFVQPSVEQGQLVVLRHFDEDQRARKALGFYFLERAREDDDFEKHRCFLEWIREKVTATSTELSLPPRDTKRKVTDSLNQFP